MNNDFKARMAQYEQELLRMRKTTEEPTVPTATTPEDTPVPSSSVISVNVVDGATGLPLRGAIVNIDRRTGSGREPVAVRLTDSNGDIAQLEVAAEQPNTVYDLTVAMPTYFRYNETGIVADGTPIHRAVRLVPLPEV